MELTDAQPANTKEKRAAEEPEISVAKESKTEENREHNEATTSGGEAEQRVEEIPIGTSLPETKRETHEEKKRDLSVPAVGVKKEATQISGTLDRYILFGRIGTGVTAEVYRARDKLTDTQVVIKKVFSDKYSYMKKEVDILGKIKSPRIVQFHECIYLNGIYYLVLESMGDTLRNVISSQDFPLTQEYHKYFMRQLLQGLAFLHKNGIVHRDIKPGNLLVNTNCDLKIADFGHSAIMDKPEMEIKEEMQTIWYRAIEVLMCSKTFTSAIDMWSAGCVFAELLDNKLVLDKNGKMVSTSRVLFPGSSIHHQIELIVKTLGMPSESKWPGVSKLHWYSQITYLTYHKKKRWEDIFEREIDPLALDLLDRMLEYNPEKRISAEDALKHDYFKG